MALVLLVQGGQDDPACSKYMSQCPQFKYQFELGQANADPGQPSKVSAAAFSENVAPLGRRLAALELRP